MEPRLLVVVRDLARLGAETGVRVCDLFFRLPDEHPREHFSAVPHADLFSGKRDARPGAAPAASSSSSASASARHATFTEWRTLSPSIIPRSTRCRTMQSA